MSYMTLMTSYFPYTSHTHSKSVWRSEQDIAC